MHSAPRWAPALLPILLVLAPFLTPTGCSSSGPIASPTAPTGPAVSPTAGTPGSGLGVTTITFTNADGDTIDLTVEIADTPEKRGTGLMQRESLAEDAGMIFAWPEETSSGFWMKNTLIPLSIAFISREGVITDIQDMEPLDETLHYAPLPYFYAVEVNQGWYGDNGIVVGDAVEVP